MAKRTDAIRSAFWRVQQATGINGGRGFYTLRKTAASEIEKIDPLVTSMFLGHSVKEMKRHYAMRNWAALDEATTAEDLVKGLNKRTYRIADNKESIINKDGTCVAIIASKESDAGGSRFDCWRE